MNPAAQPMYSKSSMASSPVQYTTNAVDKTAAEIKGQAKKNGVWSLVILLVVITIIYMILFWLLKLPIVLNSGPGGVVTTSVNFWKLLGSSFVAALITVLIIWGISKLTGGKY
jgi:hypothetical protein